VLGDDDWKCSEDQARVTVAVDGQYQEDQELCVGYCISYMTGIIWTAWLIQG